MKKPIILIYTFSKKIDETAKAMLDAGFKVAIPYNCSWSYDGLILIPKIEIEKRGVIRGGIKYLHDTFGETSVILAEEYITAKDILLVYSTMLEYPEALVLSERENPAGSGRFERIAYKIIQSLFAVVQGRMVRDMHSGVRGFPGQYLSIFYDMRGNDRDFLLGQIMALRRLNIPLVECQAISQGNSEGAHTIRELFRDILKVCLLFLTFVSSSLFSTALDLGIYAFMLHFFTESLLAASAAGRAVSSIVNFTINQHVVFRSGLKIN